MKKTEVCTCQCDAKLKYEAMRFVMAQGITLNEYMRQAVMYVAIHKQIPFELTDTVTKPGRPLGYSPYRKTADEQAA